MSRTIVLAVLATALVLAGAWWITSGRGSDVRAAVPGASEPLRPGKTESVVAPLDRDAERGDVARVEDGARLAIALDNDGTKASERPDAAEQKSTLRGRVVAPDGLPIAGARIFTAPHQPWGGPPLDSRHYENQLEGDRHEALSDASTTAAASIQRTKDGYDAHADVGAVTAASVSVRVIALARWVGRGRKALRK